MMPSLPALSLVSTRLRHSGRSRTASTMLFTGLLLGRSSVMCHDKTRTVTDLSMACTLSSVLPASSALPRVSSWSPNLRPAMAAGLPGTTSDTNTPLRWAATRSPTCSYL